MSIGEWLDRVPSSLKILLCIVIIIAICGFGAGLAAHCYVNRGMEELDE